MLSLIMEATPPVLLYHWSENFKLQFLSRDMEVRFCLYQAGIDNTDCGRLYGYYGIH